MRLILWQRRRNTALYGRDSSDEDFSENAVGAGASAGAVVRTANTGGLVGDSP